MINLKNNKVLKEIATSTSHLVTIIFNLIEKNPTTPFEEILSLHVDLFQIFNLTFENESFLKTNEKETFDILSKAYVAWLEKVIPNISCDADGIVNFIIIPSSIFEFLKKYEDSLKFSAIDTTWKSLKKVLLKNEKNVKYIHQHIETVNLSNPENENIIQEICSYSIEKGLNLLQGAFECLRKSNQNGFAQKSKLCRFYFIIISQFAKEYAGTLSNYQSEITKMCLTVKL
jgi:hypothetical protein